MIAFLNHIETERQNQAQSRNVRLTAIRSFCRMVALREPASMGITTRVLAIPAKRTDKRLVGYLTKDEVDAVLAAHDLDSWTGAARSRIVADDVQHGGACLRDDKSEAESVQFGIKSFAQFTGKGRKERSVPLWPGTAKALKAWFKEVESTPRYAGDIAFPSVRGGTLSRDGVAFLLRECVRRAAASCASLTGKRVTPHTFRHTAAMHLLQSGVDITVIALWLGHETIQTTHCYIEADLVTKQAALERLAPPAGAAAAPFKANDSLLQFLSSL